MQYRIKTNIDDSFFRLGTSQNTGSESSPYLNMIIIYKP